MRDSIIERRHIDWPDWEQRFNCPATDARRPSVSPAAAVPPAEATKLSIDKATISRFDQRANERRRQEAEVRAQVNAAANAAHNDPTLDWRHKECEKTGKPHRFYDNGYIAQCCDCKRRSVFSKLEGIAIGPPVGRGRSAQTVYEAGFPITRDWGESACPYCGAIFPVVAANQIHCGATDCKKAHLRKVRAKKRVAGA